MAPTSLSAILLGMALGGAYVSLTRSIAVLLIASILFGVSYSVAGLLPAIGIFVLTISALYCLGMLLASLFLFYQREVWHLADAMQEPIYFLSGFYFPVRTLGAFVGGIGSLIPLTLGLDAIRQLVLPGSPQFIPLRWEVLAIVVQIAVYAFLSQVSLRFLERRAREDARLILRST
jgi:ABC-2 type transport system permease protein